MALLKQAMLMDPLAGAVCSTPEISQMTDEMLIAQAQWLPQYQDEIPEAQQRFDIEPRLGTRETQGVARLQVRSSQELHDDGKQMQQILAGRNTDPGNEE